MMFKSSSIKLKRLALIISCVLILTVAVAGTLAWMIEKTEPIKNIFTDTTVDVEVNESDEDKIFEMIPGWNISKDPKVTVSSDSEDCWVFVKLEKSSNYDQFLIHAVDSAWEKGDGTNIPADVYYRKVTTANGFKGQELGVLAAGSLTHDNVTYSWGANEVLVRPTVTKAMMNALTEATYPTLTVSSKAVQLMKNAATEFTAAEAWALND